MNGFEKPTPVTGLDIAFGPRSLRTLLPAYDSIPEEFRRNRGEARKWIEFQQRWFFEGLPKGTEFVCKAGIDKNAALGHLKAIQSSFEPSHEHKQAGVAYLASLWFDDVRIP